MSPKSFDLAAVLKAELVDIERRRKVRAEVEQATSPQVPQPLPPQSESESQSELDLDLDGVLERARRMNLVGLALSGGGVRSATFNLGILQGLARRNWLGKVDYLSTVSGGGFIGAWLSNLARKADFVDVVRDTIDGRTHKDKLDHLRRMGNYLTPRVGVVSMDTLVAVVTYLRNLACNFTILMALMAIPILVVRLLDVAHDDFPLPSGLEPAFAGLRPVWILAPILLILLVLRSRSSLRKWSHILKGFVGGLVVIALAVGLIQEFFIDTSLSNPSGYSAVWGPLVVPAMVVGLCLLASAVTSRWCLLPHAVEPAAVLLPLAGAWAACAAISLHASDLNDAMKTVFLAIWGGGSLVGIVIDRLPKLGPKLTSALRAVMMVVPYIFVVGLLILISLGVDYLMDSGSKFDELFYATVITMLIGLVGALLVNVNEFSLHGFYRDRIADAYLSPDLNGDLKVADLAESPGPYHLINTTLNLSTDGQLAWQERKAASFVITPSHWGYDAGPVVREQGKDKPGESPKGYRALAGTNVRLRTAVTLSGAAASPNMGHYGSPALAMLLTLFNVRLGCWFPNPLHKPPGEHGPMLALSKLTSEFVGYSRSSTRYVYLSDGGHFENLGIYELVRRRCGFIIACDAGTDPDIGLSDLGAAIRLCRIDFGTEISIDTSAITTRDSNGRSSAHFAIGTIVYDPRTPPGVLLYIKTSLTGDESSDILDYATRHSEFPNEPLTDQFFGESQFESYRRLGLHIAESIFATRRNGEAVAKAFTRMREAWTPPSSIASEEFGRHAERLQHLFDILREDRDLDFLAAQIYIEWNTVVRSGAGTVPPAPSEAQLAKGFSLCSSAIQLMESVYLGLRLEQTHEHPDHQGWINLFRHWGWSWMFQLTWAATSTTFSVRFRNFSESHFQFPSRELLADMEVSNLNKLERELVKQLKAQIKDQQLAEVQIIALGLHLAPPEDTRTPEPVTFEVGFAVILDKRLVFLRIRDHLRASGLAKQAIKFLKEKHEIEGARLDLVPSKIVGDARVCSAIRAELEALDKDRFARMVSSILLACR